MFCRLAATNCYLENLQIQTATIYYADSTSTDITEAVRLQVNPYSSLIWSKKPGFPIDSLFNPSLTTWLDTTMPSKLIGSWYKYTEHELEIRADSLVIKGEISSIESVAKYLSYCRIIHLRGGRYRTLYTRDLSISASHSELLIAYADSSAADVTGAARLPVIPDLDTETRRIIAGWIKIRTLAL